MIAAGQIEEIIVEKLHNLPQIQQEEVLHFIEYLVCTVVRSQSLQQRRMGQAARMLLSDYEHDNELTLFTVLDGECLLDVP